MPLSKQTTDQIRKEAEDMYGPDGDGFYNMSAYITGAKKWAVWKEKAEETHKQLNQVWDYYQKLLLVIAKLVKNKWDAEAWAEAEEIIHRFSEAYKQLEQFK